MRVRVSAGLSSFSEHCKDGLQHVTEEPREDFLGETRNPSDDCTNVNQLKCHSLRYTCFSWRFLISPIRVTGPSDISHLALVGLHGSP